MAQRRKRPRIVNPCVASRYQGERERIIEFAGETTDQGGLISFAIADGKMFVQVYRQGSDVQVIIGKPDESTHKGD